MLAPMGAVAGGRLAAAVSNAGRATAADTGLRHRARLPVARALHRPCPAEPLPRSLAGRETELAARSAAEGPAFQAAVREGEFDRAMVWAGEGVDLIAGVEPAADLMRRIASDAEARLRAGAGLLVSGGA